MGTCLGKHVYLFTDVVFSSGILYTIHMVSLVLKSAIEYLILLSPYER